MCSPEELLESVRGVVVAAAGCGKTHLIAQAVVSQSQGRQLVLTHTHAGVRAIRKRLNSLGASSSNFLVTTIASWCLLYASSYPTTSGLKNNIPRTQEQWSATYSGVLRLMEETSIARVPALSYSGVLVDEYQDCTKEQHEVVVALAEILPTRVLGDPLQGIFDFGQNVPIEWEADVTPFFDQLPELTEPWRWRTGSKVLGQWLAEARKLLLEGSPLDLRTAPTDAVEWIRFSDSTKTTRQVGICYELLGQKIGSVAAIHNMPGQVRHAARMLRGTFQCAEANECPDLLTHAERIEASSGVARAIAVIELVASCVSGLKSQLTTVRKKLSDGLVPDPKRYKKNRPVIAAIVCVCMSKGYEYIQLLLDELQQVPKTHTYRREPLEDFRRGLNALLNGEAEVLPEAIWSVRDRLRRLPRRTLKRVIGTTKLLKGLEFDTVVLLDAQELSRKDLYVALTRASSRLVVLSGDPILCPKM